MGTLVLVSQLTRFTPNMHTICSPKGRAYKLTQKENVTTCSNIVSRTKFVSVENYSVPNTLTSMHKESFKNHICSSHWRLRLSSCVVHWRVRVILHVSCNNKHTPIVRKYLHSWFAFAVGHYVKDDQTEENTFEILQHSDRNRNNS